MSRLLTKEGAVSHNATQNVLKRLLPVGLTLSVLIVTSPQHTHYKYKDTIVRLCFSTYPIIYVI